MTTIPFFVIKRSTTKDEPRWIHSKMSSITKCGPEISVASLLAIFVLGSVSTSVHTAYAAGSLINLAGSTINVPITIIIPITINAQNAQICASVASSGPQTCQQIVLNPSQNSFNPISVDLSQTTPTFTSSPTSSPTFSTTANTSTASSAPVTGSPTMNVPTAPTQNVPANGHTQNVPANPTSNVPQNPGKSSGSQNSNSKSPTGGPSSSSK